MCTLSIGGSYKFFFFFLGCVWLTRVSGAVCAPEQVFETVDYTHLVILQAEIPLVVAPKCWLGDLNHQEVLIICIMVFHTTCLLFCLKEPLSLEPATNLDRFMDCTKPLVPVLYFSQVNLLFYLSSFVLFLSCSFWSLLLTQIFGWCFQKFLQLLLWFQQSAFQIIHSIF